MLFERRSLSTISRLRGQSQQATGAPFGDASFDPGRYARKIHIVSGAVILVWIGCVGALVSRAPPAAAPDVAVAIPVLAPAAAPATDAASDSRYDAIAESSPFAPPKFASPGPDLSRQPGAEPAQAPQSSAMTAPEEDPALAMREPPRISEIAPLPPSRPTEFEPPWRPAGGFDKWTAVYDISARRVYLPDGTKLEAHSGLGDRLDDPRYVDEPDRGATPPHLYQLTPREALFHGVQALRLTPVGEGDVFGRDGLLAHPYMLGPDGESNGCVSFKNYDAFLRAYQNGEIKRLAVVARLN